MMFKLYLAQDTPIFWLFFSISYNTIQ